MNFKLDESQHLVDQIYKTGINGLYYFHRELKGDDRGFFSEVCHPESFDKLLEGGFKIRQINHARSQENVVRGIHAEDWNKLVFITSGKAFCAIADLRSESETYKKVETFILGFDEKSLPGGLFISKGLGNGVAVINGPLEYIYLVDKLYKDRDPAGDMAISLFDPQLAIEWPIKQENMIISERDRNSILLK